MKVLFSFLFTIAFTCYNTQSLPINFEGDIATSDFVDFDGGTASVIANPQSGGINTSPTVAQIVRNGGEIWAGSKIILSGNLDFSTLNSIRVKVFTTAPIGTTVKFKLEGNGQTERDVQTTVSNEWEELSWDFTGEPMDFNEIVFMFDFGNIGDGSINSTFLFDDITQEFGGQQIDLPVDFEGDVVNYTTTDFGGNVSTRIMDPTDPSNTVIQAVKTLGAATWAGTTIGTPAGFATDIPLTLTDSKMAVRVWSPTAGTPIRLKVEDSDDPTHTCETETNTTVAGQWETLIFDFTNEAPGTASLDFGLSMGWTYNMASIFFNFDTDGATAGEQTYFFDDVYFGTGVSGLEEFSTSELSIFPNPSNGIWQLQTENTQIINVELYNVNGELIMTLNPNKRVIEIDGTALDKGIYFVQISSDNKRAVRKVVRL